MKLSPTQSELYEAMKQGVVCHYMPYMGRFRPTPYYFRSDNFKHCTAAAKKLLALKLVSVVDRDVTGHKLVITP